MVGDIRILLRPGKALVFVDGRRIDGSSVKVTFKKNGDLSTLRLGKLGDPTDEEMEE